MLASDVFQECSEAIGISDQTTVLARINRGVELLANKGLFDPLIGYLNFQLTGLGNNIALPREVKAVLAVNINDTPSISRNRFFEFDLGTSGSLQGDSLEYSWNDRCNVCVQDERWYPGQLTYICGSSADNGCTATIIGHDVNGRVIQETLTGSVSSPPLSVNVFYDVTNIFRSATASTCTLYCNGTLIGQYYSDEMDPTYRQIRVSKKVSGVRIMFRRHTLNINNLDSYIPLNSAMAVIQAAVAVGFLMRMEYANADQCLTRAAGFIAEEQASRHDADMRASTNQSAGILALGLIHSEGITASDVYDTACEIWPNSPRQTILKKISQSLQALANKAHWDNLMGTVDLFPADDRQTINQFGKPGYGMYVLPRFVRRAYKINAIWWPMEPRNRWFDFNINGYGERAYAYADKWDELGDVCLSSLIPREQGTGHLIPTQMVATCNNSMDEGAFIKMYGREVLNGVELEVYRNGQRGWECPCTYGVQAPPEDAPYWVDVTRIERSCTRDFVALVNPVLQQTIPGTAASYQLTVDNGGISASGVISGTAQTMIAYCKTAPNLSGNQTISVYSDVDRTQLTLMAALAISGPTVTFNEGFTINGTNFSGSITVTANLNTNFVLTATYVPATPDTLVYGAGQQFGYWYPDEIEPIYALIRLPPIRTEPDKRRIRVWYRKHVNTLQSIFEPIPLRSVLALENMMRAMKAQELGLVQNGEPLEMKAVQYLSEDRIKEGESEMSDLEIDPTTGPAVVRNFS